MYYGMILASVAMFGGCFALKDVYRRMRGSGLKSSMESSFVGSIAGLIMLMIINGMKFEFTPFTLIMALLSAVNGIAFTFLSLKALETSNLSLFSLFSMLGGMALPFAQGIIFYGEKITVAKIVCVIFICAALAMTVTRGEKKKGYPYYVGVFVLNGMSGVLSKLFNELPFEKASAAGYSIWGASCSIILSGIVLLVLFFKKGTALPKNSTDNPKHVAIALSVSAASGSVNKIANYLLLIALLHVDASLQYPMVTGGVMIVSTLVCYLNKSKHKPSKKELISVGLAFVAMLALFIIPI